MAVVKQQLKIIVIYGEIRSAHSRISRLDSLSRPAHLDLFSLFSSFKTCPLSVGRNLNLLDNGMSLASLGLIDKNSKWSLKAFDKSDDSDIEVPFRFRLVD